MLPSVTVCAEVGVIATFETWDDLVA